VSEKGEHVEVIVPAQLCPESSQRLLSPQAYSQYHRLDSGHDQYGGNQSYLWMMLCDGNDKLHRFSCPIHPRHQLPVAISHPPISGLTDSTEAPLEQSAMYTVADESNQHLTTGVWVTEASISCDRCWLARLAMSPATVRQPRILVAAFLVNTQLRGLVQRQCVLRV
jgi:hypothetical protein